MEGGGIGRDAAAAEVVASSAGGNTGDGGCGGGTALEPTIDCMLDGATAGEVEERGEGKVDSESRSGVVV